MAPVSGFTGPCPEMNTKPPATTAWEYGPAGGGPFSAMTVCLIDSPFLLGSAICLYLRSISYDHVSREAQRGLHLSPVSRRAPDSKALVPSSITRPNRATSYQTFPRAATRVSSTPPSSPTRYT